MTTLDLRRSILLLAPLGLVIAVSCADPNPSTLNQKCVHDEDCDSGQFCERSDGSPDGLCRSGESASGTSGPGTGDGPAQTDGTTGTTAPGTEDGPTTDDGPTSTPVTATETSDPESSGTTADSDDTSATDSSGAGPACADGNIDAGELCFADALALANTADSRGVAIADLDEDSHDDVIATFYGNGGNGGGVHFLGGGDGTFAVGQGIDLGAGGFERVVVGAIADFDLDVCAVNSGGNGVACASGNGDGTFEVASLQNGGDFDIEFLDLDGNGDLDYVVSSANEFLVGFEGSGSENYPADPSWLHEDSVSFPILGMAHANINADENPDLVVTNPNTNVFRVLLTDGSSGTGGSNPIISGTQFSTDAGPVDVAIGDFDNDGALDVAVAMEERVGVRLGGGNGVAFGAETLLDVGAGTVGIKVADFNLDGLDDIVTANSSGSLSILLSIDGTAFAREVVIDIDGAPVDLAVADLNEDSLPDIAIAAGDTVQVVLSNP